MANFGRRKRMPREDDVYMDPDNKKSFSEIEMRTQKAGFSYVKLGVVGFFVGIAMFVTLDIGGRVAFKTIVAAPLEKKMAAPFENLNYEDTLVVPSNYQTLKQDSRRAWQMTRSALNSCQNEMHTNWGHQKDTYHANNDPYAVATSELQLKDWSFVLPCLMNYKPQRLCEPGVKEDMIKRIKDYFSLLGKSKVRRMQVKRFQQLPNQRAAMEMHQMMNKMKSDLGGGSEPEEPRIPYHFKVDERVVIAMQGLARQGYWTEADFSSWFGLVIPKHIKSIFKDVTTYTNKCQSA